MTWERKETPVGSALDLRVVGLMPWRRVSGPAAREEAPRFMLRGNVYLVEDCPEPGPGREQFPQRIYRHRVGAPLTWSQRLERLTYAWEPWSPSTCLDHAMEIILHLGCYFSLVTVNDTDAILAGQWRAGCVEAIVNHHKGSQTAHAGLGQWAPAVCWALEKAIDAGIFPVREEEV